MRFTKGMLSREVIVMEEITIPFMVMFIVAAGATVVTRFFKHLEIMRYAR